MEDESKYCYKSEFIHDLKLQKEFLKAGLHLNSFTKFLHLFMIGILFYFFYEMFFVLDAPREFSGGIVTITGFLLILELIRLMSHRGGGIAFKRSLLTNGGKPLSSLIGFSEDEISTVNTETGSKTTFQYDQIQQVFESNNLILCGMKYRTYLIVDKRTLNGSREAFLSFLMDRCSSVRRKKVRSIRAGQIINTIKWVVVFVMLLIALLFHPATQLKERLLGQIHNGMSANEIAAELENFGIVCEDPESMEFMYGGTFYFYGSKLESMLQQTGRGRYQYDSYTWTPVENGVFYTDRWNIDSENMYTHLLEGISCLGGDALIIESIKEDHTKADPIGNDSTISLSFTMNGIPCTMNADVNGNLYDPQILNEINYILRQQNDAGLYFAASENYGIFIFFGDDAWRDAFSSRTGMELSADMNEILG